MYSYTYENGWIIHDRSGYRADNEVSKATVFALANGYLGSRGAPETISPLVAGIVGNPINGIYDSPSGGSLAHPDLHPGGPLGPFQSTQAIKQADVVLMLYLLRDRYNERVKRADWDYYEPRTAHDSSLSPMAYALVAAELGRMEWAYRYFLHTAQMDLLGSGPHWNLGVHTAALGGAWLVIQDAGGFGLDCAIMAHALVRSSSCNLTQTKPHPVVIVSWLTELVTSMS